MSDKKIIYIHGFATAGEGEKVSLIRKGVDCSVISPTLEFDPQKTILELEENIDNNTILIGTSLGGFYAWYLAYKHNINAILVNPSPTPHKSMNERLNGKSQVIVKNLVTNIPFKVTKEHSNILEKMMQEVLLNQIRFSKESNRNITMFLAKNDKVLNYLKAFELIQANNVFITENGDHGYLINWNHVITYANNLLL